MKTAEEIHKWLKSQKYQTDIGDQEYKMYYAIDMPKILEAYHESRMKEELIDYLKWFYGSHFDALDELKVNAYLATRKNK